MDPCWKDEYKTLKKARKAAKSASQKFGQKFHVYACNRCDKFHLTRLSRKHYVQNSSKIKERIKP